MTTKKILLKFIKMNSEIVLLNRGEFYIITIDNFFLFAKEYPEEVRNIIRYYINSSSLTIKIIRKFKNTVVEK